MIEKLTNNWDRDNKERIERNFSILSKIDLKIMSDFLNTDPSKLEPKINGKMRTNEFDLRDLDNFGINFTAEVNGVIHKAWVYAQTAGEIGYGLAEQEYNGIASSTVIYKVFNFKAGWNQIEFNFPVEQNKSYTLFKRNVNEDISVNTIAISGWNTHPFMSNGLVFHSGKYLDETATYTNYAGIFEIELITSIAQVYKIANDAVKPTQQFYVGDNPPADAQFWFKPVGGS